MSFVARAWAMSIATSIAPAIATSIATTIGCSPAGPRAASDAANAAPGKTSDDEACRALCDQEAHCGDATPVADACAGACARSSALLKPGVVGRIVECRHATLSTNCYGKESAFTHGELLSDARCFGQGAASYAADATNRRNWATASCDRMLRCQQTNPAPDARKLCVDASVHPSDEEDREAMTVVDALRDEVVKRWADCLASGPCAASGKADTVEEQCVLRALGKAAP